MGKKKLFTADYEIHASIKMLYPYIESASGLSEWFADDVRISPEKVFTFVWDNEDHKAMKVASKLNSHVRFEYLTPATDEKKDPSWFEIRLELDELTQTTFIKINDYSDFDDQGELHEVWEGIVHNLKNVVGG
jgi:uncharacterized protein YndB with AHSA1/START domain